MAPVSETIVNGSIKHYVSFHQTKGLCHMRPITNDTIFCFSATRDYISHNAQIEQHLALGTACKHHVPKTKKDAARPKIAMVDPSNRKLPNPPTITRPVAESNAISMQYCAWKMTDNLKTAKVMGDTLIKLAPRLIKKPSNEGTVTFYNFTEIQEKEEADKLI